MHAAGQFGHAGIEVDGIFLAAIVGKLEHFADLIDQEAVGFAAQIDTNRHRRETGRKPIEIGVQFYGKEGDGG